MEILDAKTVSDMKLSIQARGTNYTQCINTLDAIIQSYIAEDKIFNPYGGKGEHITDKQIAEIIRTVTANIIEEISGDIYAMMSTFIKPEKINDIINRRVSIAVIAMAAEINNINDSANTRTASDLTDIIQGLGINDI